MHQGMLMKQFTTRQKIHLESNQITGGSQIKFLRFGAMSGRQEVWNFCSYVRETRQCLPCCQLNWEVNICCVKRISLQVAN